MQEGELCQTLKKGIGFILTKLTSWNCALLEKPPVVQLLKNFPVFYGT
jgi:hypothetical protein